MCLKNGEKSFHWTDEEAELIFASMDTEQEGQKLIGMGFSANDEDSEVRYGMFGLMKVENGIYRIAFARYKVDFKLAPMRVINQKIHEFFGFIEIAGEQTTETKQVRIGAKAIKRMENYFKTTALSSLRDEGLVDEPEEN